VILTILRVIFLTLMGLVVAWAAFFLHPSAMERLASLDQESFRNAFPSASPAGTSRSTGIGLDAALLGLPLLREANAVRRAEEMIARRFRMACAMSPLLLSTVGISFLAGALLRERLRLGTSYASPSVCFLSKRLVEGALVVFFVWVFSPAPIPYSSFFPLLTVAGGGTVGWVGNLPLRL
jgi:hypothetical protein